MAPGPLPAQRLEEESEFSDGSEATSVKTPSPKPSPVRRTSTQLEQDAKEERARERDRRQSSVQDAARLRTDLLRRGTVASNAAFSREGVSREASKSPDDPSVALRRAMMQEHCNDEVSTGSSMGHGAGVLLGVMDGDGFPGGGSKRHKWRLCFRLDKVAPIQDFSSEWRQPQDFFVTVADPPLNTGARSAQSFFASEMACQVANMLVGRPLLELLPGQMLQNKAVCLAGKDALAAGLVAAMLGAKVSLLCHQKIFPHVQQNVRNHLREALDYTHIKSNTITASCYTTGRVSCISGLAICEELNISPWLDLVVLLESEAATMFSAFCGFEEKDWGVARGSDYVFTVLSALVPLGAPTKALLVCNRESGMCARWLRGQSPVPEDGSLDELGLDMDVPHDWHVRLHCGIPGKMIALWVERTDAEVTRRIAARQAPLRKYLPPMGSSSSRCGCGGHPQKSFLNHAVHNPEWFDNNAKLKEAILSHNRWKLSEAAVVLEEARAWAATATAVCRGQSQYLEASAAEPPEARPEDALSSAWVQEAAADVEAALEEAEAQARAAQRARGGVETLPVLTGRHGRAPRSARSSSQVPGHARASSSANTSAGFASWPGSGSHSARCSGHPKGPDIARRHERPPHFYSCQRVNYGRTL